MTKNKEVFEMNDDALRLVSFISNIAGEYDSYMTPHPDGYESPAICWGGLRFDKEAGFWCYVEFHKDGPIVEIYEDFTFWPDAPANLVYLLVGYCAYHGIKIRETSLKLGSVHDA